MELGVMMSGVALAEITETTGLQPAMGRAPTGGRLPGDWEEVYASNVVPIYRFVYSRTGNRPDAEDLTSRIFLKVLPHLRVGAPEEARAHLFATARAQLADFWRDRYHVVAETIDHVPSSPADPMRSDDAELRINRLLARLPALDRRVLDLRFLRGLSIREIAKQMHMTTGNTRVIQLRALRRVAELGAAMPPS